MSDTRFKLSFRCMSWMGGGEPQRALILGVAAIPNDTRFLRAVLALEDGKLVNAPISLAEFNLAANHEVVLVEVKNEDRAPKVLYPSDPTKE